MTEPTRVSCWASAAATVLNEEPMAGAGLDVLYQEPPPARGPPVSHPGAMVTPHAAFNSEESLLELRQKAATQVGDVLSGRRTQSIVNTEVLN